MFRSSGVKLVQPVVGFWHTTVYWNIPVAVFGIVKKLLLAPPAISWVPVNTAEPLVPPVAPVVELAVAALQPNTVKLVGLF